MRKFKHKDYNMIAELHEDGNVSIAVKESIGFNFEITVSKDTVLESEDWEELWEFNMPVGTRFKDLSGAGDLFEIVKKKGNVVFIKNCKYDETFNINVKEVNSLFANGNFVIFNEIFSDYRIMSIKLDDGTILNFQGETCVSRSDGLLAGVTLDKRDYIHGDDYSIHSVKRLSDGHLFTVGDLINNKDWNHREGSDVCILKSIGQEEGELYFSISQGKHEARYLMNNDLYIVESKGEEILLENIPCLSIKEIEQVHTDITGCMKEKLKKIVKSKIL